MGEGARFQLFGFPVTVRPGFVVIIALIAFLYGGSLGPWLAGALAAFTLIHELGHAWMARRFGATASIALDLLYGYASYIPSRALARWERALIAVAGPAVEIVLGVVVLLAMGADPLSIDSVAETPARYAIWWAGPVIGLVNLIANGYGWLTYAFIAILIIPVLTVGVWLIAGGAQRIPQASAST